MDKKKTRTAKGSLCSMCDGEMQYSWCSLCNKDGSLKKGYCDCYLACANAVGYCLNNPDDKLCDEYINACFSTQCSMKCPVT